MRPSSVGNGYELEDAYLVAVHVPVVLVEDVLAAALAVSRLQYGHYEAVAFLEEGGLEQYRGTASAREGEAEGTARVPTTRLSFSLPRTPELLARALDAIRAVHGYEEPVIYVREVLRTRTRTEDARPRPRLWERAQRRLYRGLLARLGRAARA